METNQKYRAPSFTVFDVYKTVFGYRALPYPQGDLSGLLPNPQEKLSSLGAVLFKKDANGTEAFCPVVLSYKGKKYDLPYSTVAVTVQKNIQKTALPGRRGTVKELIQIEDYQFTIQGVILGDDLPEDGIKALDELFNINEPVKLENAFTEIFLQKENDVIIESLDFPDMRGVIGAQAFSMSLVSDSSLELEEI